MRGVRQVVGGERHFGEHGLDLRESGFRAVAHGDGDGAVERDDRRGLALQQPVIQARDPRPVGFRHGPRVTMHGDDRGLQRIGAVAGHMQGVARHGAADVQFTRVPKRAVLFLKRNQVADTIGTGAAATMVQQHQRQ